MGPKDQTTKPELPATPDAAPDEICLRILALTDLHMEIRDYDYYADRAQAGGGLARAASLIEPLRNAAPNTLLFDNGDSLQGNPMGDYFARRHAGGDAAPHPMIAALNTLALDAATLGNHEFNYGLDFLRSALTDAAFPVVSANAVTRLGATPADDETFFPPYTILDRRCADGRGALHQIRVGVIGLLPPQITHWDRKHLSGRLVTRGIVETAKAYVPRIRAEGADLIVALSHSGIEEVSDDPGGENACLPLAALDGIDVIVAGHSHLVFPSRQFRSSAAIDARSGRLCGKPAVMAGFGGSHVGVVDLVLARRGGRWGVATSRVAAAPVPAGAGRPGRAERAILAATETAHRDTLAHIRRPVGATSRPLHSYFALLKPCDPVRLVAAAQAEALRAHLRDTTYANLPLLSAAAPFKAGGRGGPGNYTDVPAGDIALRHVADLYSYPNVLRALMVDGAALRAWLEHSAGIFRHIRPRAADQALRDSDFPSYNFDTIFGVTYRIDLASPPRYDRSGMVSHPDAARIRDLCYLDRPVTKDQMFVVATNDYRASRSGAYPGADQGRTIPALPDMHRDILIRHLQDTAPDRPLPPAPWEFAPVEDASVILDTGTGAEAYADEAQALGLEPLGPTGTGTLRFRRTL